MSRQQDISERHEAIRQIIRKEATLSLQTLSAKLKAGQLAVSMPTLRKDIEALIDQRFPIELKRGVVTLKAQAKTEFQNRCETKTDEKAAIAEVVTALLFGGNSVEEQILKFVGNKKGWQDFPVKHVLAGLWQKAGRMINLDSGSTTLAVAKNLAARRYPVEACSYLTVVTNAPAVVEELYKNESLQTIIVGGELRRERYSIVGHLAERCMDAFDLVSDFSCIGATGVDLYRGFGCDSVRETHMKLRLLNSRIRCVVLDHTKLDPAATFSVFLDYSAKQLDFVITDDKVLEKEPMFKMFREKLEEAGICLLTPLRLGPDILKAKRVK